MEHLTDNELLVLLEHSRTSKEMHPDHLQHCESCQKRWLDLLEPWNTLGDWTVEESTTDLTDRIMGKLDPVPFISLWQSQAWVRIAASIIIGVGLGALMGRMGSPSVSEEQASHAIYLDVLALNSSTGWTAPLLGESQEP